MHRAHTEGVCIGTHALSCDVWCSGTEERACARTCQAQRGHLRERMNSLREAARPSARRAQRM